MCIGVMHILIVTLPPSLFHFSCSRDCTGTLDSPVCGSNGVVYRNRCELSKARCVENIADLTVHKKGQCTLNVVST